MSRRSCVPAEKTAALLAELAHISPYFAVGTGPCDDGWRPVQQLYTDTTLLDGIVGRVQPRIDAAEQRVAASTFFLGFAARLWSIGLGALAGSRLLPDLNAEHLLFREGAAKSGCISNIPPRGAVTSWSRCWPTWCSRDT
jgi:iron complex transport system ATP-binding protein